jgi:putative membrane-bound dehydrogenase-like protein
MKNLTRALLSVFTGSLVLFIICPVFGEGVAPLGRDGKPLNLDFETGTLKDWTATGTAFKGQPVRGDAVSKRRGDMSSGHQGEFWIGTYEVDGDDPQGTLTSVPFKVTHPFASFLVGGGPHENTRVELALAESNKVIFKISGAEHEMLRPVVVDLKEQMGKEIVVRIVDLQSGHWGHINFDHFRFHEARPKFANERTPTQPPAEDVPPMDVVRFAGLSPEEAAKAATAPEGFEVRLFAGEPDVKQPIAMALDDQGRLWVAEAYNYPLRAPEGKGLDRILIFEDTTGNGRFNERKVFIENLNLVSGLEIGFGGVWVGAAPYLLFIPIDPETDKPAGEPQVLLDGWGYQDTHETLNSFIWGPDGWLYGCHGVFTHSNVGKPGAPDSERQRINAGIFRYHPIRHIFEVFAEGTSNPWGIDFDDYGQCFIEVCVIPHLFHVVQGARYHRQAGQHFNPHTYDDIKNIGDHVHYAGTRGPHAANNRSDAAGGGHAHAGLMVYLGDSWPEKYRGKLFMHNLHGFRVNMDIPERSGSGFVGRHGPDFLFFNDKWSQALNFRSDQDGSVYINDWYDENQCHHTNPDRHDRSNGRIFKLVYNDQPMTRVNLQLSSDEELVQLQLHRNDWHVRHSRRILQERGPNPKVHQQLKGILNDHQDPTRKVRALWALHATEGLSEEVVLAQLNSREEYLRAWAIQLYLEDRQFSERVLKELERLARTDPSPVARLYLMAGAQRLPLEKRWNILASLHGRSEDAGDHNIPLMAWYASEPLAENDFQRALGMAAESKLPRILQFMTRRVAALGTDQARGAISRLMASESNDQRRLEMLRGLSAALQGQRRAPMPEGWSAVEKEYGQSGNPDVRALAQAVSLTFGSVAAMEELRRTLSDPKAQMAARRTALDSLLGARDPQLPGILQSLLEDGQLRGAAIRALATYDDLTTPQAILAVYSSLSGGEKRDALNTLSSRAAFAGPLLEAVGEGKVPAQDLTAELVRQLRNLKNPAIDDDLEKVWGLARESTADMQEEIERYKRIYRAGGSLPGDAMRGRTVYTRICQQCHMLFDVGGTVGPDLTGSNRGNLDYILLHTVDPNAVIPNEYRTSIVETKDERHITGIITSQDDNSVTLKTANETLVIPRDEIAAITSSDISMMPEGLLDNLDDQEIRDLIYYLSSPGQVPLLATQDTLPLFFNGRDLSNWDGNMDLWSVENGEIVGRSETGLTINDFLKSQMVIGDFRLTLQVKLTPNKENSGIQFRSEALPDGDVKGYQADIGQGWWGKLYEEHGRAILWDAPGDSYVKPDDWNLYEIVAVGSRVRTAINGNLCVDLDDPAGARQGIVALQLHSGGPMEIRFKDIQLELDPEFKLVTLK